MVDHDVGSLFEDVEPSFPTMSRVAQGSFRLDAGFYSSTVDRARSKIDGLAENSVTIAEVARVFALSDFSLLRIPAANDQLGVPFYTASDIQEYDPKPTMFLSRALEPNLSDYIVEKGWILLSRSGSIGNTHIVDACMSGNAVANHAIRIVPTEPDLGALIYVLLSSELGRTLIEGLIYGSVVDQIRPAQIEKVRVPLPTKHSLEQIGGKVRAALDARELAKDLLRSAESLIYELNDLPQVQGQEELWSDPETISAYALSSQDITRNNLSGSEYRLDAHYYNTVGRSVVRNLQSCISETKTLDEVTQRVFFADRFARTFVDRYHGIPYIVGKNIVQIRPTDLRYLSISETGKLDEYLLNPGWILLTRSGTIGRLCLVWGNFEEFVGTDDLIRIVADDTEIDSGYLYAFLKSQYGQEQIMRHRHGSVIDHITSEQVQQLLVPIPPRADQELIGDKVRLAYEKRAEAIRLEDEAQAILMAELAPEK